MTILKNTLKRPYFFVESHLRGQGVSQRFTDQLLSEFPFLEHIEMELTFDNYATYVESLQYQNNPDTMAAQHRAVMSTPAYKVFSRHGFTMIKIGKIIAGESVELSLSRPSNP